MAPTLREDLFFCLTDRCAIFLDLESNRYFGLTGFADLAFRRIISGDALDAELERALEPLWSKGLLVETHAGPSHATRISPACIESVATPLTLPRSVHAPATTGIAMGLRALVATEIRILGLKAVIHRRRARKAAARGRGAAMPVERIVAAHARVDQLIGGANQCLLRSIALIDHLARHGQYPQLVIGVRTGAFAAHCWVQQGAVLLNDQMDRVRLFKPIMVL